ncbi:plant UBX domain-containing protein 7 isoform X1 [Amaranthus tricolor]|uniref:plant UBX domain-containing protein 7 isoform X1 n=1 Tax=Amaranthus tricolor TaxID=29722 RepID=UPI00258CE01E|nr:plant UBX domain-containing protein 7 isoform X1 [Amaranthus tricolor]
MEDILSPTDKQTMVSSFLEIAVGQTADTARQFLQATSWKLEEALQLFYVGNESGIVASSSFFAPEESAASHIDKSPSGSDDGLAKEINDVSGSDDVRPPLPVIREALYDDSMLYGASRIGYQSHVPSSVVAFRNFEEERKHSAVWESDQGGSSTESSRDNLAALYRPPFALMHQGPFEKAKLAAAAEDKWLLVNLQSPTEFSSHMLNRDTWANETVAQTIKTNFIFWQVYDDTSEGKKVCTYYKIESVPVVLVIDPVTGQKMRLWSGMVHPDRLLEDLLPFMEAGPTKHLSLVSHKRPRESSHVSSQKVQVETNEEDEELQRALAVSMENMNHLDQVVSEEKDMTTANEDEKNCSIKKPVYPLLPEEPKGDRNLICRVGFRLPDGKRVQRSFLRTDPIQLLWSFCSTQLGESESKPFRLTHAIPGAAMSLEYDSTLTFEESGLSNSMISVTWE